MNLVRPTFPEKETPSGLMPERAPAKLLTTQPTAGEGGSVRNLIIVNLGYLEKPRAAWIMK
jgi:hypothetical protein